MENTSWATDDILGWLDSRVQVPTARLPRLSADGLTLRFLATRGGDAFGTCGVLCAIEAAAVAAALRGGPPAAVVLGLGRIVALHHRSSTSYQIHEQIRRLYFWSGNATEPQVSVVVEGVDEVASVEQFPGLWAGTNSKDVEWWDAGGPCGGVVLNSAAFADETLWLLPPGPCPREPQRLVKQARALAVRGAGAAAEVAAVVQSLTSPPELCVASVGRLRAEGAAAWRAVWPPAPVAPTLAGDKRDASSWFGSRWE